MSKDNHSGEGELKGRLKGIKYKYKHISEDEIPNGKKVFKIKCVIDYLNSPIHQNTYFVPQDKLDDFFTYVIREEFFEKVVDIEVL